MDIKSYSLNFVTDRRPIIPVTICGVKVMAIVDTGARTPVWTSSIHYLIDVLKKSLIVDNAGDFLDKNYKGKFLVGGFGGRNLCDTYTMSVCIGNWSFGNVPVSINDIQTHNLFDFLVPADMLTSFNYKVDNHNSKFIIEQIEDHPRCKLKLYKKSSNNKTVSESFYCFLEESVEEDKSDKLSSRMVDFW